MKKNISLLLIFFSVLFLAQKNGLKKEISRITKGKNATVAVSVRGIDFPFEFNNENSRKKLPLLSIFKFHIALATLDLVDKRKLSLNQKIFIKKEDLHENTWSPLLEKYPAGNIEMTLSELMKYMVSDSDNNATDIILNLISGTQTVQNFCNSKEIKDLTIKLNEAQMHTENWKVLYVNNSTTNSLVSTLKDFYHKKYISSTSTNFLMKLMLETTTGANKIVEQLPKGTPVAHKTGASGKLDGLTVAENDIAIITLPNGKKFAIAVLVSDSRESYEVNCKMISDISKTVWDHFNAKTSRLNK